MSMHSFAANGNIKAIRSALRNKKALLALDRELGWSPLHYASNNSKAKIVQIILDAGISPNIKSRPPVKTVQSSFNLEAKEEEDKKAAIVYPMDVAEGPNRSKIINNLKEKGGKFYGDEMTLSQAVQMEDIDEMECLLEDSTTKVNERDKRGWMPIHYAVDMANKEICELLFEHKANPNGSTTCDQHYNPYEIAKDKGNEEWMKYLRSKGGHPSTYRTDQLKKQPKQTFSNATIQGKNKSKDEKELTFINVKSAPTSFLGKMLESKADKDARDAKLKQEQDEKSAQIKAAEEKAKKEKERLKRSRVIKWKWGEDPFSCKGDSIIYDTACESYTFFMDIVGYSKKSTAMQKKVMDDLIAIVKGTEGYQQAQRQGKLIILPTGDGMALVFFNSVHAAFKCAIDTGKKCYKSKDIGLRMGINTGPVVPVKDINDNPNVSGDGINIAQRVMDAGDNDHILISNGVYLHVSEMDVPSLKFEDWGAVFVKHGSTVHLHTAYGNGFGRTEFPDWRGTKKAEFK